MPERLASISDGGDGSQPPGAESRGISESSRTTPSLRMNVRRRLSARAMRRIVVSWFAREFRREFPAAHEGASASTCAQSDDSARRSR